MKRSLVVVLAALMLFAGSSAARAEEEGGVEIGVKAWMNTLKEEAPGSSASEKSNSVLLIGPVLEVKAASGFFLEASYLMSQDDYKIGTPAVEFSRNDIDLALGMRFTRSFGLQAGYRNSVTEQKSGAWKNTASGPFVGLLIGIPMGDVASINGKFNYLINKSKTEAGSLSAEEDAPGFVAEIGLGLDFSKHFKLNVGYQLETTEGDKSKVKDTFSGVTAGARIGF